MRNHSSAEGKATMNAISVEEWSSMSPTDRRREIGNMTQEQAVDLYAGMTSDKSKGPRLAHSEWNALGHTGQECLLERVPDWEKAMLRAWGVAESNLLQTSAKEANLDDIPETETESWPKSRFYLLLAFSFLLPPVGLAVFGINVWKQARLAQSVEILIVAFLSFCLVFPYLFHYLATLVVH
jgi:hypothetical protein